LHSEHGTIDESLAGAEVVRGRSGLWLVVAWCYEDPSRVGEGFDVDGGIVIGRDPSAARPVQRRPDGDVRCPPLTDRRLSRHHLEVDRRGSHLELRRRGGNSVVVDDRPLDPGESILVTAGAHVLLSGRLLLLVTDSEPVSAPEVPLHPFGKADKSDIVGETAAMWRLRARLALVAQTAKHVLILGESGVGKELVARALHAQSPRASRRFVSRNASTFPEGLIEAELFGHGRDYPNKGMAEHIGLVGAADGGTLFLDEIGDLSPTLQSTLLRVTDDGEYQRLGETRLRTADVRVVGATNRPPDVMRYDLEARFPIVVRVPPLRQRLADVPLILRHIVIAECEANPQLAGRLLDEAGEPRIRCRFVSWLLRSDLGTNVRAIHRAFWSALGNGTGTDPLDVPRGSTTYDDAEEPDAPRVFRDPRDIPCEEVARVVASNPTTREAVERLGIKDRHVYKRLRERCGLLDKRS